MHNESPGCPGMAVADGTRPQNLRTMCTHSSSGVPQPSLRVGTGSFAGAAVGTTMHRCFGLSVPQFPPPKCSYHGMAAR